MKTKSLIIAMAVALIMSGCSKFVEGFDESPNAPLVVNAALLTTNAQVALFATYNGQLARTTGIWTQQLAGTDAQMVDHEAYRVFEGDINNEWNMIYTDGLDACRDLRTNYGSGNAHYTGISQVLEAMFLGVATDLWGDVPDKEANYGLENLNPAYDKQEDVLKHIQSLLTSAIANFETGVDKNKLTPSSDDLIFGGDIDAWKKAAYMLKARYAMRVGAGSEALAALTSAGLTGISDDMNAVYGTNGNELNNWLAFDLERGGYIRMGKAFVDDMNANKDPRISFYAAKDTGGIYRGSEIGKGDIDASPIGSYLKSSTFPLISFVEAKFIEAEAKFASDKAGSASAFNAAIKAHVMQVTGKSDAAFEGIVASETASSITMQKIANQKFTALFGQIESYSSWRMLDYPVLTPYPNGQFPSIPVRFPVSLEERLYNRNAPNSTNLTVKVWWDTK